MSVFAELSPPYATIVADPPWHYDGFAGGHHRTAGKWAGPVLTVPLPYQSLNLAEIAALPVAELAATNSRLFLWATNRYLPDAFSICAAWGFRYRQTLVWHKVDANLPASVAPNDLEFVLVASKGSPRRLAHLTSALLSTSRRGGHSAKPDAFGDLVELVSPGPYVELFCRRPRLGWDHWGHGYEIGTVA